MGTAIVTILTLGTGALCAYFWMCLLTWNSTRPAVNDIPKRDMGEAIGLLLSSLTLTVLTIGLVWGF